MEALGTFDLSSYLRSDDEFDDIDPALFDDPFLEEMLSLQPHHMENKEESNPSKRFKVMSTGELENLADQRFSVSTKKNSKWGFNVFSGELHSLLSYITNQVLNSILIFRIF